MNLNQDSINLFGDLSTYFDADAVDADADAVDAVDVVDAVDPVDPVDVGVIVLCACASWKAWDKDSIVHTAACTIILPVQLKTQELYTVYVTHEPAIPRVVQRSA